MGLLSKIISLGIVISSLYPQLKSLRFKKEPSINVEEPSEEASLTEYQACKNEAHYHGTTYWAIVGIFLSFTTAIGAFFIKNILENKTLLESNSNERWVIFGISLLALFIIFFLFLWLKRTNKFICAANKRALEIANECKIQLDKKLENIRNRGTPLKGICIAIALFILVSIPWVFLAIISASKCVKDIILG